MISDSEKADEIRWYFIEVEKQWNSPEAVIARALEFVYKYNLRLEKKLGRLEGSNDFLTKLLKSNKTKMEV